MVVEASVKDGQLVPVNVAYFAKTKDAAEYDFIGENAVEADEKGVYDLGTEKYVKFTNNYDVPAPVNVVLEATKVLKDKDENPITAPADTFHFELRNEENKVIETPGNDENGVVTFENLTVGENLTPEMIKAEADGVFEYVYYISETNIDLPYYECDDTEYEVIVGVSIDDENRLKPVKVTVKAGENVVGEKTEFTPDEAGVYDLGIQEYLKFTTTYKEPSPADVLVKATKVLTDKEGKPIAAPEGTFLFVVDNDADVSNGVLEETSNDADGVVTFETLAVGAGLTPEIIKNEADGVFEYTYYISEKDIELPYYECDSTVYEVTVGLSIAGEQLKPVKVTVKAGENVIGEKTEFTPDEAGVYDLGVEEYLKFTNTYKAPAPVAIQLEAVKALNDEAGQAIAMPEGEFTFKVVSANGSTPMPEAVTAVNDAEGKVVFPAFSIGSEILPTTETNDEGFYEYKYAIVEEKRSSKDYTYDDSECEVTVLLKKENGQLSVESLIYENNEVPVFTNVYNAPEPVEIQLEATKTLLDKDGNNISEMLTEGMFSFEIKANEGTPAFPEG